MRVIVLIIVLAILGWAGWTGYRLLDKAGEFREIEDVSLGACRAVLGSVGGEDLAIDRKTGWVFVSAYDRRAAAAGDPVRGEIAVFSLPAGSLRMVDISSPSRSGAPEAFLPHGLSLYEADGHTTLAVINHAGEGGTSVVELFDVLGSSVDGTTWTRPRLAHRRTISDPSFVNPNDLVLVGHDSFYLTNDHKHPPGFLQQLETYLLLNTSNAIYFDGEEASVAASGLTYANGIAIGPQGTVVYVAQSTDNSISTYDRNPNTGALTLIEDEWGRTDVGTSVDNIDVREDGTLFIGAHPKLFALIDHARDPTKLSPSEVVRMRPGADGWEVDTVYMNDGSAISGLSTAAVEGEDIVLGSIFGEEVLVCPWSD